MCGICGWVLPPAVRRPVAELEAMARAIAHRGPDDHGVFTDEASGVALAHNRLSIIDLTAAGHQPMASEDGRVVLAYNGEIYNFLALRAELESHGHRFISRGDTEVLLKSYLQWGSSCVERLCGMFAFAIWDRGQRRLLLARDPMGIKPLYYHRVPGGRGFVFASEVKAFLALGGFESRARPASVRQFLEFGYVFEEHATMLEGVLKLPPGQTLEVFAHGSTGPAPFFTPPSPGRGRGGAPEPGVEKLESVLGAVVAEHLVADVPVGILLSGGLDSGVIAALASRQQRVTTISMGFADSSIDERPFARAVSRHIGSEHHEVLIRPEEVTDGIAEAVWFFDDLFADWGTFSTRLLYRRCRDRGIKVVLVGEGADELFGGYPVFERAASLGGPRVVQLFRLYRMYAGRRYGGLFGKYAGIMRGYLDDCGGDLFHAVRLFESRNQLPNNYVTKVDKASMSVSVEARAPFLDRRVAELAYRVPKERLLGGGGKALLRSMARAGRLLPEEILDRPKFGASIAASWIDDSPAFRSYARDVILDRAGPLDELHLRGAMEAFFCSGKRGYPFPSPIGIFSSLAWRLLLYTLWSSRYLGVRRPS